MVGIQIEDLEAREHYIDAIASLSKVENEEVEFAASYFK